MKEVPTKNNLEILVNHIYIDRALSGTSIGPRSSLQELIKTAISGNALFNCVLIYDTSRLARNTREVLQIVEEFSMMNIQCHFVSQNFNSGEESSPEILAIHRMFNALYSRELAKKVRRGMIGQINRGYYVGSRLFGYTSVPIHTHKKDAHGNFEVEGYRLEINPTEAKIVKLVFKLFAEKEWSAKKIANYLNTKMINNKWPAPTYSTYSTYWTYNTISGSKKNYFGILNKSYTSRIYME